MSPRVIPYNWPYDLAFRLGTLAVLVVIYVSGNSTVALRELDYSDIPEQFGIDALWPLPVYIASGGLTIFLILTAIAAGWATFRLHGTYALIITLLLSLVAVVINFSGTMTFTEIAPVIILLTIATAYGALAAFAGLILGVMVYAAIASDFDTFLYYPVDALPICITLAIFALCDFSPWLHKLHVAGKCVIAAVAAFFHITASPEIFQAFALNPFADVQYADLEWSFNESVTFFIMRNGGDILLLMLAAAAIVPLAGGFLAKTSLRYAESIPTTQPVPTVPPAAPTDNPFDNPWSPPRTPM